MQIIASSLKGNNNRGLSKREWGGYAIVSVAIAIICGYLFFVGAGFFALLLFLFYAGFVGKMAYGDNRNRRFPFIVFLENGIVVFDFLKQDNNGIKRRIKLRFALTTIVGYTLHSFFGMRPAFLELHIQGGEHALAKHTIPVEMLPEAEYQKLMAFIEMVIPNKPKRIDENRGSQKLISP